MGNVSRDGNPKNEKKILDSKTLQQKWKEEEGREGDREREKEKGREGKEREGKKEEREEGR
jgi:hypothetical protein